MPSKGGSVEEVCDTDSLYPKLLCVNLHFHPTFYRIYPEILRIIYFIPTSYLFHFEYSSLTRIQTWRLSRQMRQNKQPGKKRKFYHKRFSYSSCKVLSNQVCGTQKGISLHLISPPNKVQLFNLKMHILVLNLSF